MIIAPRYISTSPHKIISYVSMMSLAVLLLSRHSIISAARFRIISIRSERRFLSRDITSSSLMTRRYMTDMKLRSTPRSSFSRGHVPRPLSIANGFGFVLLLCVITRAEALASLSPRSIDLHQDVSTHRDSQSQSTESDRHMDLSKRHMRFTVGSQRSSQMEERANGTRRTQQAARDDKRGQQCRGDSVLGFMARKRALAVCVSVAAVAPPWRHLLAACRLEVLI